MSKNALVTGSSNGIGRAIALELGRQGYNVAVNYRSDKENAEKVVKQIQDQGGKAIAIQADLGNMEDLERMFREYDAEFSHIDLLVNNAAISKQIPFLEVEEEFFDLLNRVNWKGYYFCTQRALTRMVDQGVKGVVVNISSNHMDAAWPGATVYAGIKAAIGKFTENLSMEMAPHDIRIVGVAPGYTVVDAWKDNQDVWDCEAKLPLRRFAKPEEIAKAVAFLASEDAGYITGTTLRVDGGATHPVVAENDFVDSTPKKLQD